MKQKGVLVTCDRCGKTEFIEKLEGPFARGASELIIDGEVYKALYYGWTEREIQGEKTNLCPACSKIFENFEKTFMEKRK